MAAVEPPRSPVGALDGDGTNQPEPLRLVAVRAA
jgi:hypothetical protein